MNKKSILQLIELLVMVLAFSISACICVRCFVYADQLSRDQENKTTAVLLAQNAAELLKTTGGDMEKATEQLGGFCDGNNWYIPMDASWNVVRQQEEAVFLLKVTLQAQTDLPMRTALLQVTEGPKILVQITVAWQEGI